MIGNIFSAVCRNATVLISLASRMTSSKCGAITPLAVTSVLVLLNLLAVLESGNAFIYFLAAHYCNPWICNYCDAAQYEMPMEPLLQIHVSNKISGTFVRHTNACASSAHCALHLDLFQPGQYVGNLFCSSSKRKKKRTGTLAFLNIIIMLHTVCL